MKRELDVIGSATTDLVYAGVAVVATALTLISVGFNVAITSCVLFALLPWALIVARRQLPLAAFAALAIIPVIPVVACTGIGSAIFLTTAAASRVASRTDRWRLVAVVTVVIVALPFVPFALGREWDVGAVYFAFGNAFGVLVGVLLRRANQLASRLRVADAELVDAAAREERHRIGRDVHDLVAHSLTVVVLHVGGARRVLRTDPNSAEAALADAERVCRESLDGIRGVVGLLRDDNESHVLSLDFEELVTTYRSAGLSIVLRTNGAPESLPLAVRVTLYRVVQEALANAARHAQKATTMEVEVLVDDQGVVARITNDHASIGSARIAPSSPESKSGGYGLVGLREQVALLGGDLVSGRKGEAWVVECRLPPQAGHGSGTPPATSAVPTDGTA